MEYIETPLKQYNVKEGKPMAKQAKAEAPAKTYNKSRGEHAKDIIIAMLVTGVIAFIGGMHFANEQSARIDQAVKNAQASVAPVANAQELK